MFLELLLVVFAALDDRAFDSLYLTGVLDLSFFLDYLCYRLLFYNFLFLLLPYACIIDINSADL